MGIYQCEIQGKKSVSQISEDELTSRIFGLFNCIDSLRDIFLNDIVKIPPQTGQFLFWLEKETTVDNRLVEPDVIFQSENYIIFENKLDSPLIEHQLIRELNIPNIDKLMVITNDYSEPPIIKRLHNKYQDKIGWASWSDIHTILNNNPIRSSENISLVQNETLILMEKMELVRLSERMERYCELARDQSVQNALNANRKVFLALRNNLRVSEGFYSYQIRGPHYGTFNESWIDMEIKELSDIDNKLYFFIIFDPIANRFEACLGGRNKPTRLKWANKLDHYKSDYTFSEDFRTDYIFYNKLIEKPNFDSSELISQIISRTKEFIEEVLSRINQLD